jgi:hypothetical protein
MLSLGTSNARCANILFKTFGTTECEVCFSEGEPTPTTVGGVGSKPDKFVAIFAADATQVETASGLQIYIVLL